MGVTPPYRGPQYIRYYSISTHTPTHPVKAPQCVVHKGGLPPRTCVLHKGGSPPMHMRVTQGGISPCTCVMHEGGFPPCTCVMHEGDSPHARV